MGRDSPLRRRIADIVREVLAEQQQATMNADPEQGTIIAVNDDGTVNVQTSTNTYTGVGVPTTLTKGTQVTVITADGQRVAVPLGSQPLTT